MINEPLYVSNNNHPSCNVQQQTSPALSMISPVASISSDQQHHHRIVTPPPYQTHHQDLSCESTDTKSNISIKTTTTTTTTISSNHRSHSEDSDSIFLTTSTTSNATMTTYTTATHALSSTSSLSLGTLQPQARYSTLSLVNDDIVQQQQQQRRLRQRKAEISAATASLMMAAAKASRKRSNTISSDLPRPTVKSNNNNNNANNGGNGIKLTSDHHDSQQEELCDSVQQQQSQVIVLGKELIHRVDSRTIQIIVDRTLILANSSTSTSTSSTSKYSMDNNNNTNDDIHIERTLSSSLLSTQGLDNPLPPSYYSLNTTPTTTHGDVKTNVTEKNEKNQENISDDLTIIEPNININKAEITKTATVPSTTLAERHLRRRQGAIQELLDTEVSYCKDLSHLVNHFFRGIAEITSIPDRFKERLFRNCTEVLSFQTQFSESLLSSSRVEQNPDNNVDERLTRIARQFCDSAGKFDVYIDYCIYQDKATEIHKELMTNNITYQHTLDKLNRFKRATDDMNGRRMFEDYMIMPVQRLLKYKLILESMSKTVQTDTMEHEALMMGLNVMHQVALRLNSEKSRLEARRKTKLFLNRLDSDWVNAASKRFYGVLGACVLIGTLDIRILTESTKVKRLGCALFNSYMIIAKGKRHDRYEPRYWFPLRTFQVQDLPNEHPSLPHSWLLFSETQSIEFSAMCESEKQIWLDKLQGAIKTSKDEYEEQSQNSSTTAVEELFVSSFSLSSTTATSSSSVINNNNSGNNTMTTTGYPYDGSSTTSLCSYLSRSESQHVQVNYSGSSIILDPHATNSTGNNNNNTRPSTPRTTFSMDSTTEDLLLNNNNNSNASGTNNNNNNNNNMSVESPTHYSSSAQSSNVNSPGMRSQASISDFCDFVTNTVADFRSQRRHQQYSVRAIGIDNKFEDVCTTPILTARSQARNDRSSGMENSNQWKQQRRSRMGKSASMLAFTSIKSDDENNNNNNNSQQQQQQQQQQYHPNSRSSVGPTPTTTMSSPQDMFKNAVRRKASLPSRLRISEPIVNDIPVRRPPSTHSTHSAMISHNHQQFPPALNSSVRTDSMIFRLSRRGSINNSANNSNNINTKKINESTASLQSINSINASTINNKLQNVKNNPAARLPPQATPGLPRSLSAATMGLARTSSRFFGRMVEKLGTIGTPRRTRRNATNAHQQQQNSFIPPSGGTSSVPPAMNSSDLSRKPSKKSKRQLSKKPPPLIIPGSPIVRTNSITRKDRSTERRFQK